MDEYKPVNGDQVDIYIANKSHTPVIGIELKFATCHVQYQGYEAEDRRPIPTWTSDEDSIMDKIPFNTPFVHLTEPHPENPDMLKITGHRFISPDEFGGMKEAAKCWHNLKSMQNFQKREDMSQPDAIDWTDAVEEAEAMYEPYKDIPVEYWEKRWHFSLGEHHQIHDVDYDNEVLGIMDKDQLSRDLKQRLKY